MAQRLTDRGTTIGHIADDRSDGKRRVTDDNWRTVGYIDEDGTYDVNYVRVLDFPDAGYLLRD